MRKEEFLKRLEENLVMDEPEKEEVLRYYAEYIEEAGPENEKKVIEEIGSPEEVGARLSAEFSESDNGSDGSWTVDFSEMIRDFSSAVERFAKRAWESAGSAVNAFGDRLEEEWKKSEPARNDAAMDWNRTMEEVKRTTDRVFQETRETAKKGMDEARKAFASLKDIMEDATVPYEFADFDLTPFHKVKVFVKNCPVTLHPAVDGRYGADVRLYLRREDEISVTVQDDTLIIHSTASSGVGRLTGGTAGFGGQAVELYLPSGVYETIEVTTTNARIEAAGLKMEDAEVKLKTGNAKIKLVNCRFGGSLQAETGNMAIELEEISVPAAVLYTVNAPIHVNGGTVAALNLETSNGAVNVADCEVASKLTAETANGPVRLKMTEPAEAYRVTADTSNSAVFVDGRRMGSHYEAPGRIPVRANTGNARIELTFPQPEAGETADDTQTEE
ncbi:MAG: DUF4097 family beta strand repeat-containing protein [Oscillospiraceae bacterium]|nr:DUF4097 family beta strand repeat-containing protein [Oscillospiraceae bacterium]